MCVAKPLNIMKCAFNRGCTLPLSHLAQQFPTCSFLVQSKALFSSCNHPPVLTSQLIWGKVAAPECLVVLNWILGVSHWVRGQARGRAGWTSRGDAPPLGHGWSSLRSKERITRLLVASPSSLELASLPSVGLTASPVLSPVLGGVPPCLLSPPCGPFSQSCSVLDLGSVCVGQKLPALDLEQKTKILFIYLSISIYPPCTLFHHHPAITTLLSISMNVFS